MAWRAPRRTSSPSSPLTIAPCDPNDAAPGTPMLAAESRDCVRAATDLYGGILREIEKADYRVLDRRVRVARPRRLAVFARRLTAAQLARVRVTIANPKSRSSTGA